MLFCLQQGRVSEEEFIEKLQKTLKSDPQPNLVHFLKVRKLVVSCYFLFVFIFFCCLVR